LVFSVRAVKGWFDCPWWAVWECFNGIWEDACGYPDGALCTGLEDDAGDWSVWLLVLLLPLPILSTYSLFTAPFSVANLRIEIIKTIIDICFNRDQGFKQRWSFKMQQGLLIRSNYTVIQSYHKNAQKSLWEGPWSTDWTYT
jgi:hypothetical protein